ncbi:MAG: terminase large subunit, partial [Pseudomonadota bacterium]
MSAVDYVERAEAYVAGVLDGSIPANRLARLACERHVRDKEHAAGLAPTFYLDADSANHACAFIERCPHVKGEWARRGELLTLSGWQAFIIVSLFGWRWTATNARRFNTALVEVPRKNGKSALCSPILLYMFALDGEAGPEVYSAATKAAQARIVFDSAKAMARKMPDFVRRAALKIEEHAIKVKNDDVSVIKPLEAKKLDGLYPHCSVIDELHEHPTAAVYDALDQARGARDQSLLLAITTAGDDLGGVCYAQHDYVER